MIITIIISDQVPHELREISAQTQFTIEQMTPQLIASEIARLRESVLREMREARALPDNARACSDGKIRIRRA